MITRLTLCSLLALGCLSCESTSNYEPPRAGALEESQWRQRINLSPDLEHVLEIDEVLETRQHGLLRVQIDLRNITAEEQTLRTSIEWFDVSGFKLDSPNSGWMSHIVQPDEKFVVDAGAVNTAAVSWRMNVNPWSR